MKGAGGGGKQGEEVGGGTRGGSRGALEKGRWEVVEQGLGWEGVEEGKDWHRSVPCPSLTTMHLQSLIAQQTQPL